MAEERKMCPNPENMHCEHGPQEVESSEVFRLKSMLDEDFRAGFIDYESWQEKLDRWVALILTSQEKETLEEAAWECWAPGGGRGSYRMTKDADRARGLIQQGFKVVALFRKKGAVPETEQEPVGYVTPEDAAEMAHRCSVGDEVYGVAVGGERDSKGRTVPLYTGPQPRGEKDEREMTSYDIGAIIADGYDVGAATTAIADAVWAYVEEGEPNPFKEEADIIEAEGGA